MQELPPPSIATGGTTKDGSEASRKTSTDVVVAVAKAEGVDPMEMDEQLEGWIDCDALDAVVESIEDGHVEFEMAGHRVHVRANGRVFVDR